MTELKKDSKVAWEASQGKTQGRVVKKIAKPIDLKGHHVAASASDPQYMVCSDKTGAVAAHKPEALKQTKKRNRGI